MIALLSFAAVIGACVWFSRKDNDRTFRRTLRLFDRIIRKRGGHK